MDFRQISLNGEWIGRGVDEHDRWIQFTGVVPGCVHTDFIREKIIDFMHHIQEREQVPSRKS